MKLSFYLVVNDRGTTKTCKNRPALDWNEIAIHMQVQLPDALFKKPSLQASITIPDEAAVPTPIDATVQENIRLAIEQHVGMAVQITVCEPEPAK